MLVHRIQMLGFLVLALISYSVNADTTSAPASLAYQVQPGDILEISVWKEPDLSKELLVPPDGNLAFPLIGHLQAQGATIKQLQADIAEKLSRYIPDPSVTVSLLKAAGNLYYVVGKVNRPGQYPMVGPTSVLQALSMAGGMTTYASENGIKIIRNGKKEAIAFRYGDIEDGEQLQQNILLESGDVVLVP
ncbi:MAG: polysaccharide biosynthesis/export family protein [Pseudomonadota bacterium]|nr:polysaccharide biosynthesis/export family protein [Pseudomonadota bacterium]